MRADDIYVIESSHKASSWPAQFDSYVHATDKELFCSLRAVKSGDLAKDTQLMMDRLTGLSYPPPILLCLLSVAEAL